MRRFVAVALAFVLSACGSGISGIYADPGNDLILTFNSNGKVDIKGWGGIVERNYRIEGRNIKLETPEGTMVLPIGDDGSIDVGGTRVFKRP